MPTDQKPKQLIVERIQGASNILVTVSHNPSVDELAAALGLTLMLDKMGKVATAVFSGQLPKAIDFLEPGKTFEENVDSLRDFIIALDKSKADRLRYKVEGDVVRIFITPFKTVIRENDLKFSEGDFNVDLIVALGVTKREDLDAAITAHGRILHDAATVTINTSTDNGSLGEVDWTDTAASGYCEILMSLSDALQGDVLNEQIATALLTGLVSATDRFRNEKTSPKVMTIAAQLMAAGANQQLIAEKLEEASEIPVDDVPIDQLATPTTEVVEPVAQKTVDGEMKISHSSDERRTITDTTKRSTADTTSVTVEPQTVAEKKSAEALSTAEAELEKALSRKQSTTTGVDGAAESVMDALKRETNETPIVTSRPSSWRDLPSPSLGGTLNATTEEAHDDNIREEQADKNRVLLSHDTAPASDTSTPSSVPVLNATTLPPTEPVVADIFAQATNETPDITTVLPPPVAPMPPSIQPVAPVPTPVPVDATTQTASGISFEAAPLPSQTPPSHDLTLADIEAEVEQLHNPTNTPQTQSIDDAMAAVNAAFQSTPFNPAGKPLESVGAQSFGSDIDHDNTFTEPTAQPQPAMPPTPPPPTALGLPPLPDFSTLPPLPGQSIPPSPQPSSMTVPNFGLPEQPLAQTTPTQVSNDPTQFRLPGQ